MATRIRERPGNPGHTPPEGATARDDEARLMAWLDRHPRDAAVHGALIACRLLPEAVIGRLLTLVSRTSREELLSRHPLSPAQRAEARKSGADRPAWWSAAHFTGPR